MLQSSFNNKQLPVDWKYANITALYKKALEQMSVTIDQSVLLALCVR